MSKDDRELIATLRGLLATATPELTNGTVSQKTLADLLRLGAEHQRPQADNWNSIDWRSDAALIVAAIESLPALLTRLEALQAQPVGALREALEGVSIARVRSEMVMTFPNDEQAIAAFEGMVFLCDPETAFPPVVEREAIKGLRERVCKLTMPDGAVIEAEYPKGGDWAKSWSIRYPPDMKCGTTGEQDWELVEKYGLTEILDAAILALTPVEGVGEATREQCAKVAERIGECANTSGRSGCCETTGDDIATAIRDLPLSTPVAQGDEVRDALRAEIINTPETADFMAGVPIEATHQRERWGASHDAGKSPFDWFWLIGYLSQKAADAQVRGDAEKAKHHTISTAAALANWHLALSGETDMRPGIGPGNGGDKPGSAFAMADALATLTKGARDAG